MAAQCFPPGLSNITALSSLVRPGTPGRPSTCLLTGAGGTQARGCRSQGRLTHVCAQWAWPRESWWCFEEGPDAVVGGTWAESAPPTLGAHLACRATPANGHTWWFPGPRTALPCPASSLLSDSDPAVTTEPGPKALWKHRCQRRPRQLRALRDHCRSLWKPGRAAKEPSEGHGRQGRSTWHPSSSLFPWLCGCQSDARQTPNGVDGTGSLGKFTVCPVRATRLPPESSTLHIRNVPSGMQCKQRRRKVQLLGGAGTSWEASPYTSVAMTHSFLSSDIKHTD